MGFRLVTNEESIMFNEPQDVYKLGSIDEESWIVYESDGCVIEEDRNNSDNLIIVVKEADGVIDYDFITSIFNKIKGIRKNLEEIMELRTVIYEKIKYFNDLE